jgi:Putative peptidoglycan binding domain
MSLRTRAVALAVAATFAAGLALSTTPASASTSSGFISGSGDWHDDWNDEGPISASSHSHSDTAAMWQAILWADGYLSYSGIDCQFGPTTTSATESWQRNHGLSADGVVGANTLTKASTWLSGSAGSSNHITYAGTDGRYVTFVRASDSWNNGIWYMYIGSDLEALGYNQVSFIRCVT